MVLVFVFVALWPWHHAAYAAVPLPTRSPVVDIAVLSDISPKAKAELDRFYDLRNGRPVWNLLDEEAINEARSLIDSIESSTVYHGLNIDAYRLEEMRKLATSAANRDKQKLEFLIIISLLRLVHDLHGDNVNLDNIYPGWNFHRQKEDIPALLNAAITNKNLGAFLKENAPQHRSYGLLASALQTYSEIEAKGGWPMVTPGPSLRVQDHGDRVAQLRARLTAEGYRTLPTKDHEDYFDDDLSQALIAYQKQNGLSPDGRAGIKTQEALNIPIATRVAQIRANMERWRHMPEDFPADRYVLVNIPDFSVAIHEDGSEIYRGTVIVGRADRRTPFINSQIYNMVVNPSWHVPTSIARKDILPKLQEDPLYLEKQGVVIKDHDQDPFGTTIDWKDIQPDQFDFQLRQVPGILNSLGRLKFNFRNPFAVYMHGTPHQELFKKAERNFSSGCVRLEEPIRVGEVLLENNTEEGGWNQQRIWGEIDTGTTKFITLTKPIPVYFLYWSVFSDEAGLINFRKDIYGYDLPFINNNEP